MRDALSNQKIIAIVNPIAGVNVRVGKKNALTKRLPTNAILQIASSSKQVEELAYQASLQAYSAVIAAGGDGTVHAVLNGMMRNPDNRAAMGIIAMGTANDYAKSLQAYRVKNPSESSLVDIGRLRSTDGTRYFANVAGIGLSSRVARHAKPLRGWPAGIRYSLAVLRCLRAGLYTETIEVMINGDKQDGHDDHCENTERFISGKLLMMSIAIGSREGSFELAKQARFDDGLFNTLQVGNLSRWDLLYYFPGVLQGRIPTSDARIRSDWCREVQLRCQHPIAFHLDGEFPEIASHGLRECTFDVLKQCLKVHIL